MRTCRLKSKISDYFSETLSGGTERINIDNISVITPTANILETPLIRRPSLNELTPKTKAPPTEQSENDTPNDTPKKSENSVLSEPAIEVKNESQDVVFLTNLVFEQQRAYNELFDNYKSERKGNIELVKQNRELCIKITKIKSKKICPAAQNDFSCQTETSPISPAEQKQPDYQKLYIASLKERIESLEYHLKKQYTTIVGLLHKQEDTAPSAVPTDYKIAPADTPGVPEVSKKSPPHSSGKKTPQNQPVSPKIAAPPTAKIPPASTTSTAINSNSIQHSTSTTSAKRSTTSSNIASKNKKPPELEPRKEVVVVGDSMIKELNGFMMGRKNFRVTTHSLPGANISEMKLLTRTLCIRKPQTLVIHVGTNDLYPKSGRETETIQRTPLSEEEVASGISDMVNQLKNEFPGMNIIVSKLIIRDDHGQEGKTKVKNVNALLSETGIPLISHNNIQVKHLNGSKLHLERQGNIQMSKNIVNFLQNYA